VVLSSSKWLESKVVKSTIATHHTGLPDRGFDTVSIDDVMADAGLTRGSFYRYFESKGDLYSEAVTQILNEKQLFKQRWCQHQSACC
jgi:AcrR family transcriptional regulator